MLINKQTNKIAITGGSAGEWNRRQCHLRSFIADSEAALSAAGTVNLSTLAQGLVWDQGLVAVAVSCVITSTSLHGMVTTIAAFLRPVVRRFLWAWRGSQHCRPTWVNALIWAVVSRTIMQCKVVTWYLDWNSAVEIVFWGAMGVCSVFKPSWLPGIGSGWFGVVIICTGLAI